MAIGRHKSGAGVKKNNQRGKERKSILLGKKKEGRKMFFLNVKKKESVALIHFLLISFLKKSLMCLHYLQDKFQTLGADV